MQAEFHEKLGNRGKDGNTVGINKSSGTTKTAHQDGSKGSWQGKVSEGNKEK